MNEERSTILRMLHEGKINLEEAEALLDALEESDRGEASEGANAGHDDSTRKKSTGSSKRMEFDFDFSGMQRDISETVNDVLEGVRESLNQGSNFGQWVDNTFGAAKSEDTRILSHPADGLEKLVVRNARGHIKLKGVEAESINVRAHITVWGPDETTAAEAAAALELKPREEGNQLVLEARLPGESRAKRFKVDYELEVPRSLSPVLSSLSGDISVEDAGKRSSLKSKSGSLSALNQQGGAELKSISGDIRVLKAEGEMDLTTISGGISISDTSGQLLLKTKSGRIDASEITSQNIESRSISGAVRVAVALEAGGKAVVRSTSGRIDFKVPQTVQARISARSVSGKISNDLHLIGEERIRNSLSGVLGSEEGSIELSTVSGKINLGSA